MDVFMCAGLLATLLHGCLSCPDGKWDFTKYYTNDEISEFLQDLASSCAYPTELYEVGQSYEGRTMTAIKIGDQSDAKNIWVDGGIHGNEWIGPVTAMYIACQLCNGSTPESRELLDRWNWFLLPVVNPDAYEYTWTTDRQWRKTRQPSLNSSCIGVDPNRNFDFMWGTAGNTTDACARNYQGPEAYSEPEVKAVTDFVLAREGTWEAYLNLHSAMECWIAPYGYTSELPPDWDHIERAGWAAVNASRAVHGVEYDLIRTKNNSGTAKDWGYGGAHIKYSYTVELRSAENDTDRQQLPPEQIIPTGEETWAGIVAFTREVHEIEYGTGRAGSAGASWLITAAALVLLWMMEKLAHL